MHLGRKVCGVIIVRVLAAGLLGLALLLAVDTNSVTPLVESALPGASVATLWQRLDEPSLRAFRAWLTGTPTSSAGYLDALLEQPAWLMIGGLGLIVAALARRRRPRLTSPEPVASAGGDHGVGGGATSATVPPVPGSELKAALGSCRTVLIGVALFSGTINLLMLTSSIYMLEVYDRVLTSGSVPTLIAISILAAMLFLIQGLLEFVRGRLLVRVGSAVDEALSERVFDAIVRLPLKVGERSEGLQPQRDLESIRAFLSGLGPTALFDLPWLPLYIGVIYLFHPWLGIAAASGAAVLILLTLATEMLTRGPTAAASAWAIKRNALAEAGARGSEVLTAMGMSRHLGARWLDASRNYLRAQQRVSDVSGGLGAVSRVLRIALQSGMLGLGAYLVIKQQATAGIIIAASILVSRALAPVDLAISNWRGLVVARQAWARLEKLLARLPAQTHPLLLPPPSVGLLVEGVSLVPPGAAAVVLHDVGFSLKAGQGLGIIGPSASGKSCLARVLLGIWQPTRGSVRLDSAALDQWPVDSLGRHVGYLPQQVTLLAGTVAQNIARFDPSATAEEVVAAARAAGAHEMIVGLGAGYETEIGLDAARLSGGQQQRVALARALFRSPFLVVLDEPNSSLDAEGEAALTQAILGVRARNGIVVVIAHRPSAIAGVDVLLVMNEGRVKALGPKDEVLSRMVRPTPPPQSLKIVTKAEERQSS